MPTLGEARAFLSRYAGQGNSFAERINFATARLLPEVNAKGTKVTAQFAVYKDARGNRFVTLPRELEAILAGAYQAPTPDAQGPNWFWCGQPIPIRNSWYQYSASGPGNYVGGFGALGSGLEGYVGQDWQRGIIPMEGRYTTFCDWVDPMRLRLKVEVPEVAGSMLVRGELSGQKIYSQSGGNWIEGVEIDFTNADVTTTQTFDRPPYEIVKSITKGRVQLYMVDSDNVETLVGYYEPQETNPSYIRYIVPICATTAP